MARKRCPFHSRAYGGQCELDAGHAAEWCVSAGDCFAPGWDPKKTADPTSPAANPHRTPKRRSKPR